MSEESVIPTLKVLFHDLNIHKQHLKSVFECKALNRLKNCNNLLSGHTLKNYKYHHQGKHYLNSVKKTERLKKCQNK